MRLRTCGALLLLLLACVTTKPSPKVPMVRTPRVAHLERAAALPWTDGGRCVVQEASQSWRIVVERCFHALDTQRVRFRDTEQRCPVASMDAASVETLVGICLLAQPELVVGAVVVIGVVVVAVAIHEELETYALTGRFSEEDEAKTRPAERPVTQSPLTTGTPTPRESPLEHASPPPGLPEPPVRESRPECAPLKVPHRGGNTLHNTCADRIPNNSFSGGDVLANGKNFDGLQLDTLTLWEVKTDEFSGQPPRSQRFFVEMKLLEIQRERRIAQECGYRFVIGVRSQAHKEILIRVDPDLAVTVMDWC